MRERGKVSVCVPCYNHARFLSQTIESVLGQTYSNIELVVADDGSTDSSLELSQRYAERNRARMKVLTHPNRGNRGISETLNLATTNANGEFWMSLGSDDLYHPDKLRHQVDLLSRNASLGWVYSYADKIDESGRRLPGLFGWDVTTHPYPIEAVIFGNPIPALTVMVRRQCMDEVGAFDPPLINSDWEYWVRLLARYPAGFSPEPLASYRIHRANISVGIASDEQWRRALAVMEALKQKADVTGGALATKRTRALLELQCAICHFALGEQSVASAAIAAAFRTDPFLQSDRRRLRQWLEDLPTPPGFLRFMVTNLPNIGPGAKHTVVARTIEGVACSKTAKEHRAASRRWEGVSSLLRGFIIDPARLTSRHAVKRFVDAFFSSECQPAQTNRPNEPAGSAPIA